MTDAKLSFREHLECASQNAVRTAEGRKKQEIRCGDCLKANLLREVIPDGGLARLR